MSDNLNSYSNSNSNYDSMLFDDMFDSDQLYGDFTELDSYHLDQQEVQEESQSNFNHNNNPLSLYQYSFPPSASASASANLHSPTNNREFPIEDFTANDVDYYINRQQELQQKKLGKISSARSNPNSNPDSSSQSGTLPGKKKYNKKQKHDAKPTVPDFYPFTPPPDLFVKHVVYHKKTNPFPILEKIVGGSEDYKTKPYPSKQKLLLEVSKRSERVSLEKDEKYIRATTKPTRSIRFRTCFARRSSKRCFQ